MAEKDYNVPELTTEELQKRIRKIDTMDLSYGYVQLMEATRVKYGLSIYDRYNPKRIFWTSCR